MKQIINDCLKYIDRHIEDDLTVDLIANNVGYSKYHFSRLFKEQMGSTIKEYIIEQRLICAARDIIDGTRILDVAVKYHYDTHTGFSKAFKKKFGYSPSLLYAMKITEIIFRSEGGNVMEPREVYKKLIELIGKNISDEQLKQVEKAYKFAMKAHKGKKRYSSEEYVTHPLNVAIILANMDVPLETIIIGILHDCNEDDSVLKVEEINNEFGKFYYNKVKRINELNLSDNLLNEIDIENEEDVVLVKLADRLHNMKTLKHLNESRWKTKAEETMKIFSPLAEKMGIIEIKAELDSLSIPVISM